MDWREIVAWVMSALLLAPISAALRADVPTEADRWQREVTRAVHTHHGLEGPVALHGALIHQESRWQADAESPVGAQGLAQIMPQTAEHAAELIGRDMLDPMDPRQAIRGMAAYTAWIRDRVEPTEAPWAMTLSAYNGGVGWLQRDREQADEPDRWWCAVEDVQTRGDAAHEENRHYVREIMLEHQPRYLRAGWQGPRVYR